MTTGQFVKETRLIKGLTQEELAAKTDISVRTIQRIENGEVEPRAFTLQTIAPVLGLVYDDFIKYKKQEQPKENNPDEHLYLALLHFSGLFILVFPPIIVWIWQKDKINGIREHAIDVINFQISMFIYLVISGVLVFLIIGLPLAVLLGVFSSLIIIINTIKVLNRQTYKYPLSLNLIKL